MKLEDLSGPIEEAVLPFLDRADSSLSGIPLTVDQRFWRENGYLIKRNFLPHSLIDAYVEVRKNHEEWLGQPTAYMNSPQMRGLCLWKVLTEKLKELIGIEMGLNLVLCGWRSTERNWHPDSYLNPAFVGAYYLAVWMALEEIHPEAGPFQFVPGSHRWPVVTQQKILQALSKKERDSAAWPKYSERILTRIYEKRIEQEDVEIKEFIPASKGDILIWHAGLAHRGSKPKNANLIRKSLIAHYSGIGKRPDFPPAIQQGDEGWYYPIPCQLIPATGYASVRSKPKWKKLRQWMKKIPGVEIAWRRWKGRFA